MALLIVEALGLSRLRFVKAGPEAETEAGADKQHSEESEVNSSSPSDGIQQENKRAEEEATDGSLNISSDVCSDGSEGKSEAGMKQVGVEDLAVMFFELVEWFEHKAEENEYVCGIFICQDELTHLANVHTLMKQRLLCCSVTASLDIAHG
ncbi:uncharacterized protein MONOS_11983 [Monocercomonoides exilis]|uniref:uncharacterized protein n=1 Tax=Monocercomonoides exilis TaxID=2049356 RepID=UPI00355986A6|nr:hypothetical protein MONOS_11983 [Monocercomonoides exilis]|eukprot:MONOS_11983.1-p1 / transcript=MONOS_11983.1 / gene=MONOS_11983 / organism=Monocercomonoides_exilis_PA203 / gene_product=unspecified product / transcript_product=unspecified product / location=Mono_scaffold00633:4593-5471(-) / protein_length=151 / sequence_SO=supercontig / SO=protein_coding / is_pseudo=false